MGEQQNDALESLQKEVANHPPASPTSPFPGTGRNWLVTSFFAGAFVGVFCSLFLFPFGWASFHALEGETFWKTISIAQTVAGFAFGLLMGWILGPMVKPGFPRVVLVLAGPLAAFAAFGVMIRASREAGPPVSQLFWFALAGLASGVVLILGVLMACKPARNYTKWIVWMLGAGLLGGLGFALLIPTLMEGVPLSYACGHALTAMPLGLLRKEFEAENRRPT